ncbi:MAG: sensor histidine kinase, partial [Psychrobium sp.]
ANSITPLSSLAQTAHTLMPEQLVFDEEEDKADLAEVLLTISNRTNHLNNFIRSFNQISSLPAPDLKEIDVNILIKRVIALFKAQTTSEQITLSFYSDTSCLLMADVAQIEQSIINIIKNSLDAVADAPKKLVQLNLYQKVISSGRQQLILDIEDYGPGVALHVVEQIFVPFFTTKKSGSGIGLSLSRQIMLQHGGDLQYIDKENIGACFRLSFGIF